MTMFGASTTAALTLSTILCLLATPGSTVVLGTTSAGDLNATEDALDTSSVPDLNFSVVDLISTDDSLNTSFDNTTNAPEPDAARCDPATCLLPDCRCVGPDIPGNLRTQDVPQMVLLTVDDAITTSNYHYVQGLLPERNPVIINPNGCPATATFFVSESRSNMSLVKALVERGNEVASHSLSHSLTYKHAWSPQEWDDEIQGMRELLANSTGLNISQIRGMRAPNLQLGGDVQFSMLKDRGFLYDSSMYGGVLDEDPSRAPLWPFTLDFPPYLPTPHAVCDQSDCPTRGYPQLWEVQLMRLYTVHGESCAMADACPLGDDVNKTDILAFLRHNFHRHYERNRAPLMIAIHPRWFTRVPASYQALKEFLLEISQNPDVWQVTVTQMLDWVRNPKPLPRLHELPSWQCPDSWQHTLKHFEGVVFMFCTFTVLFVAVLVMVVVLELRNAGFRLRGLGRPVGGRYTQLPLQDLDALVEETLPR